MSSLFGYGVQVVCLLVDRGKVLIHSLVKHQFTQQFKALSDLPWLTVMNHMTMSIRTLTVNDASVTNLSKSEMLIMLHITLHSNTQLYDESCF